ncbi:MAG: sortase [Tissierellia bacterium]|nr:sortase [Tissierellia bacterium]
MLRVKNLYFLIGTICICAAAFLFAKNILEDKAVNKNTQIIVDKIKQAKAKEGIDKKRYLDNPNMEMPIKMINGYDYIGYLRIESLELDLPILSSWSYPNIKISPARFQGSIYQNNMIILAHNYDAHFGKLYKLKENDKICFYDMANNKFTFKVKIIEDVRGDEVEKLLSGDWDLTLFTCTLSGEFRTLVRCDLEG